MAAGGSTGLIMQWRIGTDGTGGIYTFSPKPSITRTHPGKRIARLIVPLQDGEIIQNLGQEIREIQLRGFLFTKNSNDWDDMETQRNNLINGVGIGPGQLHIITSQRHLRYDGQISPEGVQFAEQERASDVHEYDITILVPNPIEINEPLFSIKTINSDTEISP